ncbi:unnamed protein product, partial [Rotaria magnacalcarata]
IPYYGNPTHIYGKRVTTAVAAQYPLKQVRVVYDITARIGHNFTTKDKIPTEFRSGVIYEATCPVCNEKYIGQTCRHLKTRINEHLSYQKRVMPSLTQPHGTATNTTVQPQKLIVNSTFHMITRSQSRMNQQLLNQRKLLAKLSTILTREKKLRMYPITLKSTIINPITTQQQTTTQCPVKPQIPAQSDNTPEISQIHLLPSILESTASYTTKHQTQNATTTTTQNLQSPTIENDAEDDRINDRKFSKQ